MQLHKLLDLETRDYNFSLANLKFLLRPICFSKLMRKESPQSTLYSRYLNLI